ncbi:MAG: CBS domain-containing protein [Anaerolineales bacterium]
MSQNEIRRLPVTDEAELVGIVTLVDVRVADPS